MYWTPWLQPIVDTGCDQQCSRILGYEWLSPVPPPASSAVTQPAFSSFLLTPERIVLKVDACDSNLRRIRDYCRESGLGFALDDVGTGEKPVQTIRELRPDYIRLGADLTADIEKPVNAATIRSLVEHCGRFETIVIARGVSQIQTMENLWLLGVHCMQGGLFGDRFHGSSSLPLTHV
jgi:EAL domain-containing protein (putative c-di-GMP-specific phosphodiesterase class I)